MLISNILKKYAIWNHIIFFECDEDVVYWACVKVFLFDCLYPTLPNTHTLTHNMPHAICNLCNSNGNLSIKQDLTGPSCGRISQQSQAFNGCRLPIYTRGDEIEKWYAKIHNGRIQHTTNIRVCSGRYRSIQMLCHSKNLHVPTLMYMDWIYQD